MSKKYLVIVTITDEDTLREQADSENEGMEVDEMVSNELGWITDSGLSANVVRELSPKEATSLLLENPKLK